MVGTAPVGFIGAFGHVPFAVGSDAVKTTQVTQNLIQLNRLRFVNAYLVREEDGLTLVDTTLGKGAAAALIGAARAAGAPIRRIALTHAHGDHAGGLDALRRDLGDVQVLMPARDVDVLDGERVVEGRKVRGSWPKLATRPDAALRGGERVGSLEVVPTPGHTPGHVSFLDTRDRSVIAGDVFTSYGGVAVTNHFHLRFPLAAVATWHREHDLESAQALRDLAPSILLVGHGPAVKHPLGAMDAAIARAQV
jgi:glyoxylase-like metal-dependent hydrolase (beta-lactamase superfamily II)